jgi:regulatory protein
MKISAIKAQQKRADQYSIFIDGKYAFSLSGSAVLEKKLSLGQELDKQTFKQLMQVATNDKMLGLSIRYAGLRPHTEWEMSNYLKRKHASPALADLILNKLRDLGLVDDFQFAKRWVENRRLLHPASKRKLQQELRSKRVNSEAIQLAISAYEKDEYDALLKIISKKRVRYPDDLKLMQYLARQGFNYDDIKSGLKDDKLSGSH